MSDDFSEKIQPEPIGRMELKIAKQLCVSVFRLPVPLEQEAIADKLRQGLEGWRTRLDKFRRQAEGGRFPGLEDIEACQRLVMALQAIEDPCERVRAAVARQEDLTAAGDVVKQLKLFYKSQRPQWAALETAVSEYSPFRDELEKEGVRALDRLVWIQRAPRPFEWVSEISGLTATLKGAYLKLVDDQRARSEERLDRMVAQVRLGLDRCGADPQLGNRALHPLRQVRGKLAWASRVPDIRSLSSAAEDHFKDIIEELASAEPSAPGG